MEWVDEMTEEANVTAHAECTCMPRFRGRSVLILHNAMVRTLIIIIIVIMIVINMYY